MGEYSSDGDIDFTANKENAELPKKVTPVYAYLLRHAEPDVYFEDDSA